MSLPATLKRGEPIKRDDMFMPTPIYICARHAHDKRNKLVCVKVNCRWSWRSESTDLAAMPDCGICPIRSKHSASIEKNYPDHLPKSKNVPYVNLCGNRVGIQWGTQSKTNQNHGSMFKVSATLPCSGSKLGGLAMVACRKRKVQPS